MILHWLVLDQTGVSLKQVSTQGTARVVAGAEPLVQTCRVELLLASPTRKFGQRVVSSMEDVETDVAFLKKIKLKVTCKPYSL